MPAVGRIRICRSVHRTAGGPTWRTSNLPSCLSQKQRFRASRRRLLFHWVRLRFGGGGPWWPSAAGSSPSHARPLLVATTGRCGPFRRCAGVGARQPGDTRVSIRVHVDSQRPRLRAACSANGGVVVRADAARGTYSYGTGSVSHPQPASVPTATLAGITRQSIEGGAARRATNNLRTTYRGRRDGSTQSRYIHTIAAFPPLPINARRRRSE